MEDEVERETEFLQGDVISWPSSCFIAGTSFCAAESWRTNTHTHTHASGWGCTAAKAVPVCQPPNKRIPTAR